MDSPSKHGGDAEKDREFAEDFLARSDVLSLNLPLNQHTWEGGLWKHR